MPVVSNTSPILNLAIVGQIDLLCRHFGQIQIPPAVLDELKIDEERPGDFSVQSMPDRVYLQVGCHLCPCLPRSRTIYLQQIINLKLDLVSLA